MTEQLNLIKRLTVKETHALEDKKAKEIMQEMVCGEYRRGVELFDIYRVRIASVAYKVVGDYDEAKDIAQKVFIKICNRPETYDSNQKFYTWLYRVTINASIDHLRSSHRKGIYIVRFSECEEKLEEIIDNNGNNPYDLLIKKEIKGLIVEALDKVCTPEQREVINLFYDGGLTYIEIEKFFDKNVSWVRDRLCGGRKKIRGYFELKGYETKRVNKR